MNPLTNVKNITKLSERDLEMGLSVENSWHNMYKDSAWIFVGGLHFDLSEGDIIAVFSQYGEIVNINLVRDRKTGKSRGFAFICYENQRSTVLAVDNFNGISLLNRIIRVDHVQEYRIPKEYDDVTPEMRQLYMEGCAPKPQTSIIKLEQPVIKENDENEHKTDVKKFDLINKKQKRKDQKKRSKKNSKIKKRSHSSSSSTSSDSSSSSEDAHHHRHHHKKKKHENQRKNRHQKKSKKKRLRDH
ncbi:RNA-binding motif protein [Sarcoptes scabiei]|uniref:RNA-binding motif protein, X-linked 2 n=1 Tax=Sarcoptes scabiei TaxID=52283 RepID=A0A131ZYQ3_SARSC|nr:RNA-binding motif protein [Sarcoptes scabiei]KPM03250.1 RNA recognition motif-containing protein [Sarcoptes scabiei]